MNLIHTCGFGSTGPFDLADSGTPSVLLLESLEISVECLVSVLDNPSCFPLSFPELAGYNESV